MPSLSFGELSSAKVCLTNDKRELFRAVCGGVDILLLVGFLVIVPLLSVYFNLRPYA
jgi:hypothetical protein